MVALDETLALQIGQVLMYRREGAEFELRGDLLERRGILMVVVSSQERP